MDRYLPSYCVICFGMGVFTHWHGPNDAALLAEVRHPHPLMTCSHSWRLYSGSNSMSYSSVQSTVHKACQDSMQEVKEARLSLTVCAHCEAALLP